MLLKVVDNPSDDKFRLVATDNAVFQRKIGRLTGGLGLLAAVGFQEDSGLLMLAESDYDVLTTRITQLRDSLLRLQLEKEQAGLLEEQTKAQIEV
jgi:hypothetical protein